MDMDMDVNWCLTCSKRTLDARNPYCSEECRQGDLNGDTPNPQATSTTPLSSCIPLPKNPRRLTTSRPGLTPVAVPLVVEPTEPTRRDRRAFSFPATHILESPKQRRDSFLLPAFARKPQLNHCATTSNTTPVLKGLNKASLKVPGTNRELSKSSGATTPLALDSVFCSTSESSDNEGNGLKPRMGTGSTARPVSTRASRAARPSLPVEFNKASMSKSPSYPSKSPSYLSSKQYAQRKQSQSPVSSIAAAVPSSSSSRSREDIISWAKAVKSRPGDTDTSEDETRGRTRTRKQDSSTNDDTIEEEPLSTTPKGPLQSVFSGLTIGRLGPIVKALTSVTGTGPSTTNPPPTGALGLHAVPAPATVSRVDVTASSGGNGVEDNQLFFGGATPTLSTISFSEANEPPSIATDIIDHDHVDMATDDQSAISSHHRRGSTQARNQYPLPSVPKAKEKSNTSLIWNIPSYIRSFAPFSIMNPHLVSSKTSTAKTTPSNSTSTGISEPLTTTATTPLPASRIQSPTASPGKVARSIPLDIKMPVGTAAHEDRIRERQAEEYLEQLARSRRSRSRRESRSRGRSSANPHGRGRSPPLEQVEQGHTRMISYDADQSGTEAEDEEPVQADLGRRGRSHRSKALGPDIVVDEPSSRIPIQSLSATRSDDVRQSRSRGRRESPIGRGRDRGRDRTIRG